jgi:hypothetical protein
MQHAGTLLQRSYGAVPLIRAFRICWRVIRPQSTACPSAWRMKFSSKCQQELPKPGPQVRQDYGLGTHAGEGDLSREINTPKNIVWQSYGLGPARICFKPQTTTIRHGG